MHTKDVHMEFQEGDVARRVRAGELSFGFYGTQHTDRT